MAKATKPDGTTAVNDYMLRFEHPFKAEIEAVRAIILNANAKVQERVKWNAPSANGSRLRTANRAMPRRSPDAFANDA